MDTPLVGPFWFRKLIMKDIKNVIITVLAGALLALGGWVIQINADVEVLKAGHEAFRDIPKEVKEISILLTEIKTEIKHLKP